jgi:hypothetical protein
MIDHLFIARVREIDGLADDRVHNAVRRQKSDLPAIAITRVSGAVLRGLGGEAISQTALYRVDVYAETHAALDPVVDAVRAYFDGFRGYLSATCFVAYASTTGPSDFSDDDGDFKLRHQILDVELTFSED